MAKPTIQQTLRQEAAALTAIQKTNPMLFERPPVIDGPEELREAGITLPDLPSTIGYIRYYPQDFIVEEVHADGTTISTIEPDGDTVPPTQAGKTIFADLIKAGIATVEAKNRLAASFHVSEKSIGHAGIKDEQALTAQRLSFRGVSLEALKDVSVPNLMLTRFAFGNGTLTAGDLFGNRFSIVIRTEEPPDAPTLAKIAHELDAHGMYNFYGLQRFGSRLKAHVFGAHLLRGDYNAALRNFLFATSPRELPVFSSVRVAAKPYAPDWKKVRSHFETFSYTFQYELTVLDELIAGHRPERAFFKIEQQVRLWVYAYMSVLVNRLLSDGAAGRPLPPQIPIPLSQIPKNLELYRNTLNADEINVNHLRKLAQTFPFFRLGNRMLETKVMPQGLWMKRCPVGAALTFTLPVGAYATSLLMHFFRLSWGTPVPTWLKTKEVDSKALFGTGTIEKIKPLLGDHLKPIGILTSGGESV